MRQEAVPGLYRNNHEEAVPVQGLVACSGEGVLYLVEGIHPDLGYRASGLEAKATVAVPQVDNLASGHLMCVGAENRGRSSWVLVARMVIAEPERRSVGSELPEVEACGVAMDSGLEVSELHENGCR